MCAKPACQDLQGFPLTLEVSLTQAVRIQRPECSNIWLALPKFFCILGFLQTENSH
jgi:hypothetical protein